VAVRTVLPALPAYPARPEITWQANVDGVALPFEHALQLRDWLINEQAWKESVTQVWKIMSKEKNQND
jgi:hypothetical protein